MSISNFINNIIEKRRKKIRNNYPGEIGKFFRAGGNELLFNSIDIDDNSIVIDGGAYDGEFICKILERFGCKIIAYEPNKFFFEKLNLRFKKNKRIFIHNNAIWSSNSILDMSNDDLNSSIYAKSRGNKVNGIDVIDIMNKYQKIDLMKLNVEGAEYEILNRLINEGQINNIKNFLIQFHKINEDSQQARDNIREIFINKGYKEIFNYTFVWELWSKE